MFIDSVEWCTQSDWAREQRAEPVCDAAIRYLLLGSPLVLPNNFLLHLAPHKGPPLFEVRSLADQGRLYTDDDGILLLAQKLTPLALSCPDKPGGRAARLLDGEPTRICVPLLMRPRTMRVCHANASCHLGVARKRLMLKRFYWWIGMSLCMRWWLHRCLQSQVRKSSRQSVRWPILSLPLPSGPGVAVSVDYFGPLPVTLRGNCDILLFTDRFSRCAHKHAVSAAEFTAGDTAEILVNRYIAIWRCPASLLSDNRLHFCFKL